MVVDRTRLIMINMDDDVDSTFNGALFLITLVRKLFQGIKNKIFYNIINTYFAYALNSYLFDIAFLRNFAILSLP